MPMPNSSTGIAASCAFCAPGSADSFATSGAGRIKRELRRRSAIEAVIGHMKAQGHLGRCYLRGRAGDAANVILSAIGYNLRLVLAWLRMILRLLLLLALQMFAIQPAF